MNVIESNKMIASFMGLGDNQPYQIWEHIRSNASGEETSLYFDNNLRYNSSYDWLMPVVERIEELGSYLIMERKQYNNVEFSRNSFKMFFQYNRQHLLHLELKWRVDSDTWKHPMYKDHIIKAVSKDATKIDVLYMGIVEFIQWYNETKKS